MYGSEGSCSRVVVVQEEICCFEVAFRSRAVVLRKVGWQMLGSRSRVQRCL